MATTRVMSEYDRQASEFLARHNLTFRATVYPDDMQTPPEWSSDHKPVATKAGKFACGLRYRIVIGRKGNPQELAFDYWDSINNRAELANLRTRAVHFGGERFKPTAYGVLACISSDQHCPDMFKEFCLDYGYDQDSMKAHALWQRCREFAKQLREFFTAEELTELAEIQ